MLKRRGKQSAMRNSNGKTSICCTSIRGRGVSEIHLLHRFAAHFRPCGLRQEMYDIRVWTNISPILSAAMS